jgi:hypothetical protein
VIETFFAIPFSDLFQVKSTSNFFCDRRIYKRRFRECKQLKRVRIHDRIIQILTIDFVSLLSRTRRCECSKTLANSTCVRSPKKRSPSVWRKCFVCVFDGPTISRPSVECSISCIVVATFVVGPREHESHAVERVNTFIHKAFLSRRSRVQNVLSARL